MSKVGMNGAIMATGIVQIGSTIDYSPSGLNKLYSIRKIAFCRNKTALFQFADRHSFESKIKILKKPQAVPYLFAFVMNRTFICLFFPFKICKWMSIKTENCSSLSSGTEFKERFQEPP